MVAFIREKVYECMSGFICVFIFDKARGRGEKEWRTWFVENNDIILHTIEPFKMNRTGHQRGSTKWKIQIFKIRGYYYYKCNKIIIRSRSRGKT